MAPTELQIAWFSVIGFLFIMYAILDGFDLGIGFWYLFTNTEEDRRTLLNAIGPLWDGNEVWLIAAAGGLFAAFPLAYATVFSSLYLAVMVLIWALLFRAVAFEFRSQLESQRWRSFWDLAFVFGSILPALLLGVAMGNILHGLPLDETQNFSGGFLDLLNPYALLVGLLTCTVFATHGALYLVLRTEKNISLRAKKWAFSSWLVYIILFLIVSAMTILSEPQILENFGDNPLLWVIPLLSIISVVTIRILSSRDMNLYAFISSALAISLLLVLAGVSLYPNIVPALDSGLNITISNAASSNNALFAMLLIAIIGMPFVLIYTAWIYKIFVLEKVSLGVDSY